MSAFGAAAQLALLSRAALSPAAAAALRGGAAALLRRPLPLATACAAFYLQLQLSFVCLSRMSAVSHSLANSVRRPVTVIAGLLVAPAAPTRLMKMNCVGVRVALACAGAVATGVRGGARNGRRGQL